MRREVNVVIDMCMRNLQEQNCRRDYETGGVCMSSLSQGFSQSISGSLLSTECWKWKVEAKKDGGTCRPPYQQHLRAVFQQLSDYGAFINLSKCWFGVTSQKFHGHQGDSSSIRPLAERVEVIHAFPLPSSQCKLREFLGLVNFHHRFSQMPQIFSTLLTCYWRAPKAGTK